MGVASIALALLLGAVPPTRAEVRFAVVGDTPSCNGKDDVQLTELMRVLREKQTPFLLHAGDLYPQPRWAECSTMKGLCSEYRLKAIARLFERSVPVIVTPGGAEYTECVDPAAAISMFRRYILPLRGGSQFGRAMPGVPENITWSLNGLHFISAAFPDAAKVFYRSGFEEKILQTSVVWIDEVEEEAAMAGAKGFVVLMHLEFSRNDPILVNYQAVVKKIFRRHPEIPVLFIHGNTHQRKPVQRIEIGPHPDPSNAKCRLYEMSPGVQPEGGPGWVEVSFDGTEFEADIGGPDARSRERFGETRRSDQTPCH
ncbi:MAG: hypothetical protein U1E65_03590 [Myxococcota bacterium]